MTKKINFTHYKKLKELEIDFSPYINIIAGTNGTCKSSLLHVTSNAYRSVIKKNTSNELRQCLDVITSINNITNPKIESLVKGDKIYNDPAPGTKGTLLTVTYFNNKKLDFRRHNSAINDRYSIKPIYAKGSGDSLPEMPVIYLGLPRLLPIGEYSETTSIDKNKLKLLMIDMFEEIKNNICTTTEDLSLLIEEKIKDSTVSNDYKKIRGTLPLPYKEELSNLYKKFTGMNIALDNHYHYSIKNIKNRGDFSTEYEGIDSNTISAGEDNLYVLILALVSLKYYFEQCVKDKKIEADNKDVQSILLIDEIDATLHPSYQIMLLDVLDEYSKKYNIQVICTSHSLSLIQHALKKNHKLLYLLDLVASVSTMDITDYLTIESLLREQTAASFTLKSKIPIITEDSEARFLLNLLFDYYSDNHPEFVKIKDNFEIVECNIGGDGLTSLFNNRILTSELFRSLCILDGDKPASKKIENNIILLPGKDAPEIFLMEYLKKVIMTGTYDYFWSSEKIIMMGYQKKLVERDITSEYDNILKEIEAKRENSESTKGIKRHKFKKLFNEHLSFFEQLFLLWLNDNKNEKEITEFFKDLEILYRRTSPAHNLNPNIWNNIKKN